uniref:RFX-type winged-helix domain-containing protein n=2 Tax=Panagrolaimus sp. ES5 TaxID=591445 RepID=A0AC34G6P2_9BILA
MSIDGDETNSLSHTARTSPATLIWLSENYEPCEGSSLPRCTLYTHYKRHCAECALDPVNPASFGKLIRSVFRGLKTRRLGTRGNSKYHYYGIRIKPNSQYINEVENDRHMIKHGRRSDVQQQQQSSSNGYATRAATAAAAANVHVGNNGNGNGSGGSQSSASPSSTILPVPTSGSSLNGHSTTFAPTTPNEAITTNGGFINSTATIMEHPKSPHHEISESFAAMMGQISVPSIEIPTFEDSEAFLISMDLEILHAKKFIDDYLAACTVCFY